MDTTLGEKALGKDQTISGKVQEALGQATAQARGIDQQRGISKNATDVSTIVHIHTCYQLTGFATVLLQSAVLAVGPEGLQLLHHHLEADHRYPRRSSPHRGRTQSVSCQHADRDEWREGDTCEHGCGYQCAPTGSCCSIRGRSQVAVGEGRSTQKLFLYEFNDAQRSCMITLDYLLSLYYRCSNVIV